jgi:hypothetical protein
LKQVKNFVKFFQQEKQQTEEQQQHHYFCLFIFHKKFSQFKFNNIPRDDDNRREKESELE